MDGYANFRAFARYLDIKNAENKLGGKVAFHIDLHNFTMVNQEIGRENGDVVLKKYYNMIKDAIGDTGIVTRLGGDKFVGIFDRKKAGDVKAWLKKNLYNQKDGSFKTSLDVISFFDSISISTNKSYDLKLVSSFAISIT